MNYMVVITHPNGIHSTLRLQTQAEVDQVIERYDNKGETNRIQVYELVLTLNNKGKGEG